MPLPPLNASTRAPRSRSTEEHVKQIVRALRTEGATDPDTLFRIVGGPYWKSGQFEKALAVAQSDGRVHRSAEGSLQAL